MRLKTMLWLALGLGFIFSALILVVPEFAFAQDVVPAVAPAATEVVTETDLPKTVNLVLQVLLAALTLAGTIIGSLWAKGKMATEGLIRKNVKNEALQSVLVAVNGIAFGVAEDLYQDSVKYLKAANKDGKLSKEDIAGLKSQSVGMMWERVPKHLIGALREFGINDLDGLFSSKVREAAQLSKERNYASLGE